MTIKCYSKNDILVRDSTVGKAVTTSLCVETSDEIPDQYPIASFSVITLRIDNVTHTSNPIHFTNDAVCKTGCA